MGHATRLLVVLFSLLWAEISLASQPFLDFAPTFKSKSKLKDKALVEEYLVANARFFGIKPDLSDVWLTRVSESLLGSQFYYQKKLNGIGIALSDIIVSLVQDGSSIYRVYADTQEIPSTALPASRISMDEAYDTAWRHLHVTGELIFRPKATIQYIRREGKPKLVWQVELGVTRPYGYWIITVDAVSSEIYEVIDQRTDIKPGSLKSMPDRNAPLGARKPAFDRYAAKAGKAKPFHGKSSSGSGFAFDPDPRTALADGSLQDDSEADLFDEAYIKVALRDIKYDGKEYRLSGPWVAIDDFDPPENPPSRSNTGIWTAKRGNNEFNETMTYFHLDSSQRYLQSLGYSGDKGIQYGPIRVDADGADGQDNSYFQASTNSLAFGHGCVDDNEDADVILHEYGHAIIYSISPNFLLGDTGAIGEGFGDYWAGSYSWSTAQGRSYFPEQVFSWDGHGVGNVCWNGRILNALELRYDHTKNYEAHQSMPGGERQSDELWSTPIFQALLALDAQGRSRKEVDQILLESFYGLGAGIKMRDMATSIVQVASLLFPNGPHAPVFKEKFRHHGILDTPHVALSHKISLSGAGDNGKPDPGETVGIAMALTNKGTLAAEKISAEIIASDGAEVIKADNSWDDIAIGTTRDSLGEFLVKVTANCGKEVKLTLKFRFNDKDSLLSTLILPIGAPIGAEKNDEPNVDIPDKTPEGIMLPLDIEAEQGIVSQNFQVNLNLVHTYVGDITVNLISPHGTVVRLHNREGGTQDDLRGTYPTTLTPTESLSVLVGEPLSGTWKLHVADSAIADTGKVLSWGIRDVVGYKCE